ncbi:MAG: hypothetical protein AAF564_24665 [Bacteroidota bacterium]
MYCTHKSSIFSNILGILIISGLLLAGCSTPEEVPEVEEVPIDAEAFYFEPIGQGSQASFVERTEEVVRDSLTWVAFSEKMQTVLPFQDVDFSQEMVVFAAVPATHGGVTVQFESAERVEDELVLSYMLGLPGADCRIIDSPSVPFQVMITRKVTLPVRFEYREERHFCTMG